MCYLLHPLAITKSDREFLLFPENQSINSNLICIKKVGSRSSIFLRYLKDFLKCCFYIETRLYYTFSHMVHWKTEAGFRLD